MLKAVNAIAPNGTLDLSGDARGRKRNGAGWLYGARRDCRLSVLPPRADLPIALDIWLYFNAARRKGGKEPAAPARHKTQPTH